MVYDFDRKFLKRKMLIVVLILFLLAISANGVYASTGTLEIYIKNESGSLQPGAVVVLYDSYWKLIDKKTTDTSGKVSWIKIIPNTCKYEVYFNGEFWGAGESIVRSGSRVTKYFYKSTPGILSVSIKDNSSNEKTTFIPGEKVHVDIVLKNPGLVNYDTESILRLSQDKNSPIIREETHGPVFISSGNYGYFGLDWNIPITASGTFYLNPQALTNINNNYILTDNAGWGWNFEVALSPTPSPSPSPTPLPSPSPSPLPSPSPTPSPTPLPSPLPSPSPSFKFQSRALYVWGAANTILENSTEANILIQFSKEHNISTLFLYTDQNKLLNNPQQFNDFIARAHNNNLYVHALSGNAAWITNQMVGTNFINNLLNYNKNSQDNEKFDGIHLDIEPYVLSSWEMDSNGDSLTLVQSSVNKEIATKYLQLLSSAKGMISAKGEGMTFGVDIPFWFDSNGFELFYNGNNKLLSSHVQDITDFITIMDYTDNYINAISWATNEMNYGEVNSKNVVLAFETQQLSNSGSSFYEEGNLALEYMFQQVTNSFSSKLSFKGFAIHYYESYRSLKV